jgi:hypothetical protein
LGDITRSAGVVNQPFIASVSLGSNARDAAKAAVCAAKVRPALPDEAPFRCIFPMSAFRKTSNNHTSVTQYNAHATVRYVLLKDSARWQMINAHSCPQKQICF